MNDFRFLLPMLLFGFVLAHCSHTTNYQRPASPVARAPVPPNRSYQNPSFDAERAKPKPIVLTATDFHPDKVGPFTHDMSLRDAAVLCWSKDRVISEFDRPDQSDPPHKKDVFDRPKPRVEPWKPSLVTNCSVQIDGEPYDLQIRRKDSEKIELLMFSRSAQENRSLWEQDVDHLLKLMRDIDPKSPLRVLDGFNEWGQVLTLPTLSGETLWNILAQKPKAKSFLHDSVLQVEYIGSPNMYLVVRDYPFFTVDIAGSRGNNLTKHLQLIEDLKLREEQEARSHKPIPLDPAKDIRPSHIGPFSYQMPIEEAAKLCGAKLSEGDRLDTSFMRCEATIHDHPFTLVLTFKEAQLVQVWLQTEEELQVYRRTEWINQTASLLKVFQAIHFNPKQTLQVLKVFQTIHPQDDGWNILERSPFHQGKAVSLWQGKGPLTAQKLLALLPQADLFAGVAVIWEKERSSVLYASPSEVRIEMTLSSSSSK